MDGRFFIYRKNLMDMDDICQLLILRDQGIITQTHHTVKVVVVKSNAGKAGDYGPDAAFCEFFVDRICFFSDDANRLPVDSIGATGLPR